MKSLVRSVACLLLVVFIIGLVVQSVPHSAAANRQQNQQEKQKGDKLKGYKTLTIKGEAVAFRAVQLGRESKAVARAMKDLERRGLRRAFDKGASLIAMKNTDVARSASPVMRPASFQGSTTISDGDYEVTFISYDDGDPNTWEGIMYQRAPDVGEYTYYAQLNISSQQASLVDEWFYPVNGGDPISINDPSFNTDYPYETYEGGGYYISRGPSSLQGAPVFQITSFSANTVDRPLPSCVRNHNCPAPGSMGMGCFIQNCGAIAVGCIAAGAGWPACFGWGCAGVLIFFCML